MGSLPLGLQSDRQEVQELNNIDRGQSTDIQMGHQRKLHGRAALKETVLAPGNGINGDPRQEDSEDTSENGRW